MHEVVRLHCEPRPLRDALLIAAFADRFGTTAAVTVQYLVEQFGAELVAEIDPDEFFDFTVRRPLVCLDGETRTLDWPTTRVYAASLPEAERDVVLLVGIEPALRWQTFSGAVSDIMAAFDVREAVFVASYPGPTPHTRAIPVRLSTRDTTAAERFGIDAALPTYEGPTGISGVLMVQLETAGIRVSHLSAMAPFYLAVDPNPRAMSALAETLTRGLGTSADLSALREHVDAMDRHVAMVTSGSTQLGALVRALEQQFDFLQGVDPVEPLRDTELASSAELLMEVERFLKEQGRHGGREADSNAVGRG